MAKTTAPLLSFGARGQIGKTMVGGVWKGVPYMRQYTIPANPQTADQMSTRNVFSTLQAMWKIMPTLAQAPWTANAVGQKYTDRNKFTKENLPLLRPESDMQLFVGSPGNLGGIALTSINVSTGTTPGGVDWTATPPTAPTGWTLASVIAVGFPDQDPGTPFVGPVVAQEDTTSTYGGNLAGFPESETIIVAVFPKWTRPDGRTAYGPSLTGNGVSDAT